MPLLANNDCQVFSNEFVRIIIEGVNLNSLISIEQLQLFCSSYIILIPYSSTSSSDGFEHMSIKSLNVCEPAWSDARSTASIGAL